MKDVYHLLIGVIPLPLAILGLLLSCIYAIAVVRAMLHRRVSRKCYILLLNRSVGDVITCAMAMITAIYVLTAKQLR